MAVLITVRMEEESLGALLANVKAEAKFSLQEIATRPAYELKIGPSNSNLMSVE